MPQPTADSVVPYKVAALAFERATLSRALAACNGSASDAAQLLDIPESTFRYKARKARIRI